LKESIVKIPAKYAPILFGFLLSCFMSLMVSGISTFRALGLEDGFFALWFSNWITSWIIAFPVVLVVAPIVRRMVAKMVVHDA
jgi:hypothetical protein